MNWNDERAAFETRLTDNFTDAQIEYPGVPISQPASSWVRMSLLPSLTDRISLGPGGTARVTGVLVLSIFTPANQGTLASRQLADTLGAIFNEAVFELDGSGLIRCFVPRYNDVGQTPEGTFYQANLVVDYQRDVVLP